MRFEPEANTGDMRSPIGARTWPAKNASPRNVSGPTFAMRCVKRFAHVQITAFVGTVMPSVEPPSRNMFVPLFVMPACPIQFVAPYVMMHSSFVRNPEFEATTRFVELMIPVIVYGVVPANNCMSQLFVSAFTYSDSNRIDFVGEPRNAT